MPEEINNIESESYTGRDRRSGMQRDQMYELLKNEIRQVDGKVDIVNEKVENISKERSACEANTAVMKKIMEEVIEKTEKHSSTLYGNGKKGLVTTLAVVESTMKATFSAVEELKEANEKERDKKNAREWAIFLMLIGLVIETVINLPK